jgi:hypothetical protein
MIRNKVLLSHPLMLPSTPAPTHSCSHSTHREKDYAVQMKIREQEQEEAEAGEGAPVKAKALPSLVRVQFEEKVCPITR